MAPRPSSGPDPDPPGTEYERPTLALPKSDSAFVDQQIATGKFFGKRFPSHAEFVEFLQANLNWEFNEQSYYECSMSCCGGGPVGEGMSTDIDLNAPGWYREFERQVTGKENWKGSELVLIALGIDPKTVSTSGKKIHYLGS